jgi:hypothetical protein
MLHERRERDTERDIYTYLSIPSRNRVIAVRVAVQTAEEVIREK